MDGNKNRNEWMWLDKVNTWLKRHQFSKQLLVSPSLFFLQ